jgi:hypothetical protein
MTTCAACVEKPARTKGLCNTCYARAWRATIKGTPTEVQYLEKKETKRKLWYSRNRERLIAESKARYQRNKDDIKAKRRRAYLKDSSPFKTNERRRRLKSIYGLSVDDFQRIFERQLRQCAICLADHSRDEGKRLCVDHCHVTGKVRGLLCTRCNVGLGLLGDSEAGLNNALSYLKGAK